MPSILPLLTPPPLNYLCNNLATSPLHLLLPLPSPPPPTPPSSLERNSTISDKIHEMMSHRSQLYILGFN